MLMLVVVCMSALSNLGHAQQPAADKPEGAGSKVQKVAAADPLNITITVTAQKEAEPALSVPLSVTAITAAVIQEADINVVKKAAAYAPNVFIVEFSSRAVSNPFFRGVGGSPTNPGVSTFIDGVPQLNSFSSNIEMLDVAQIEFVRGPEGALYGRNTAGGLINISSRPNSEVWTTRAQVSFGSYGLRDLRASVSSPMLRGRFGFNLAGGYGSRDGYTQNMTTGNDLDGRLTAFWKGQMFFKPSGQMKIRLVVSGERERDGDYALGDLDYIRTNPNRVRRDFEGFTDRDVYSATLMADYHGDVMDVSSISGGVWWKNRSFTDLDYQTATLANGGLYALRDNVDRQRQFTQEFRFTSTRNKPISLTGALCLDWQGGIFIFKQNYRQNAANDISSIYGFFPRRVSFSSSALDDWGLGIYGQAKFIAWGRLDFSAGLRFDYEDKSGILGSTGSPQSVLGKSFSQASPQFSISYRHAGNQMAYIAASRGYKAGGFNPAPTGVPAPPGTESYGAEHTWSYELGYKARWLKSRIESMITFFYIDWKNLQLNQQIPLSGGQYYIGNAGAANSKGMEIEARYYPFSWWELFATVGYTRARFLSGSYAFNSNLGINQAVAGNILPFTPTYTASAGVQISRSIFSRAMVYLRYQIGMSGSFQYDASNTMGQSSFSVNSFRGGVRIKHWFAEGWVDNAFNAHYMPIAIPYAQLGAPSGYVGESGTPRTLGIRAGISF